MTDESEQMTEGPEDDVREVRRVHRQWWAANRGLDVERMRECFAPGYLMWNLNSHPYFSLAEKEHLFRYYKQHMVPTEPPELWDVRVTVDGDMAYVTSEGILPVSITSGEGSGSAVMDAAAPHYERRGETVRFRFRETVVLRRDDGRGNRAWKIWHFHCSPLAPLDEPRPGFGDTAAERGTRGPIEFMQE
jgi:ketosteroid isomerase-like protein